MVEISEFCSRILESPGLQEKLRDPGSLTDLRPLGLSAKMDRPKRTIDIAWDRNRRSNRTAFPKLHRLHDPQVRGQVLHFFANHELLALELMAYQLLKFPDAPKAFRVGLAQTMRDEQKHMRMYLQRMSDWAVQFGEYPLSGYFWNALAEVSSPLKFVAGMSLTFEQANLDFASYFAKQFRRIDDESTAKILDQVLIDEMKHVHHGLHWFETWRSQNVSALNAHRSLLHYPLNLSRAKGTEYRSDLRRKIGFSDDYINELKVLNFSKGRLPSLFVFNPSCESEVAGSWSYNPNRSAENLRHDLETLIMLFAVKGDMVWVGKAPRPSFLQQLEEFGFMIPEFVVSKNPGRDVLTFSSPKQKLARLMPWGRSPVVLDALQEVAKTVSSNGDPASGSPWDKCEAHRYSKSSAVDLLRTWYDRYERQNSNELIQKRLSPISTIGTSCATISEVCSRVEELKTSYDCVVIKAAYGNSGRGMIRCYSPSLESKQSSWVNRMLRNQGSVVVEPWLERVCDISARYSFNANGQVRLQGIGQFLTDQRGQFRGVVIGPMTEGFDGDLQRFVHDDGHQPHWMESFYSRMGKWIAEQWAQLPFRGPFAVDALIYRDVDDAEVFRLKPIVEINPRHTMGHIGDRLRQYLAPKSMGILNIVRIKDIPSSTRQESLPIDVLRQDCFGSHRAVMEPVGKSNAIKNGVVFLTDVDRAREFAVVLSVDSSIHGCCERLWEIFGPRACIPPHLRET